MDFCACPFPQRCRVDGKCWKYRMELKTMDAPKRIMAWSDDAPGLAGTWSVTRYPENAEPYILAAEHDRIVAEKDAEIEEAFARGVNWAQEKAKVEGRLVIVDSPELVNLRTEIARLREAMDGAYERAEKRRKAFYDACHGTDEGMEASLYKMFLEGFDAAIRAMKGE